MIFQIFAASDISAIDEHLSVFSDNFILRMHRNCYFWASGRNSDMTITFIDPNYSKEMSFGDPKTISSVFIYVQVENMLFLFLTLCKNREGWANSPSQFYSRT